MRIKNIKTSLAIIVSLFACIAGQTAFGNGFFKHHAKQPGEFDLLPRLHMWGFSGDNTLAYGQGMLPVFGNQNQVLYGVGEANAVQGGSWLLAGGAGYRRVVNNRIFGGYLLANYNTSEHNNPFWILNPGIEMLGTVWDADINGYFPLSQRKNLGKVNSYNWHIYNKNGRLNLYEEVGTGGDFEIGRIIPHFDQARLYVGGYYFNTEDAGSITGASGRLVYTVNQYVAVELADTYDNENHNKILAGLRLTVGGYTNAEKQQYGIASRLLDPIQHKFAILAGEGGLVVPSKQKIVNR